MKEANGQKTKMKELAGPSVNAGLRQGGLSQGPARTRRSAKRAILSTKPYLDMLDVTEVCEKHTVARGSGFLPDPDMIRVHIVNAEILQGRKGCFRSLGTTQ